MNFGEFLLWTIWIFLFVAFLMVLWTILSDLFRDGSLSGWAKAAWIIALIFVPLLSALIYLIARGRGMQERKIEEMKHLKAMQDDYIRSIADSGKQATPAEQIAQAKKLLDDGVIDVTEFNSIKAKALA